MEKTEILRKMNGIPWYHSFELLPGITTPGRSPCNPNTSLMRGIKSRQASLSIFSSMGPRLYDRIGGRCNAFLRGGGGRASWGRAYAPRRARVVGQAISAYPLPE
jgi:hypothetical protein